jgi:hypothetical protein
MLTIIMPFYKKFAEFEFAFRQGNLPTFNALSNLELLVCVDAPCEADLLTDYLNQLVIEKKLGFSLKVLLNEEDHPWRCPSAAINVGIKQAKYDKLLVISPETLPLKQSILTLLKATDAHHFALGIIKHARVEQIEQLGAESVFITKPSPMLPYGSICFTKDQADTVGGYDETFKAWGGDDDDFRLRLLKAGFLRSQTLARFLHSKFEDRELNRAANLQEEKSVQKIAEKINAIKQKDSFIANQGSYGLSFSKVIFQFMHEQTQSELV